MFLGFTQNGYGVLTVCVIQLFLVFTQNGTNPFLSNSLSLSLYIYIYIYVREFCWESCLLILKRVVKERQKKRKGKRFPFLGVCVYSADSLLSAAAVTTRLFVTAVLELGAKLILQKPITI